MVAKMSRLLRRGSKTKLNYSYKQPGHQVVARLEALNDGVDLGEFSTTAEAKAQAESLLSRDRSAFFLVQEDDGTITEWIRDFDEHRRLQRKADWRNAFVTAGILVPVIAVAIFLVGIPPFSKFGLLLVASGIGYYLFMRMWQNAVESMVAWLIMFVLVLTILSMKERRKSKQESKRSPVSEQKAR